MNLSMTKNAMAYFRIVNDNVDPVQCTSLLGVEPTQAWAKGDVYYHKRDGQKAQRYSGLWTYKLSSADVSQDPVSLYSDVLRIFTDKASAVAQNGQTPATQTV